MFIVNLSVGCLDIIDTPSINNTRRAITKNNIKYVQINNIPKETGQEFCLVIRHHSWSKGVNEDLHLYLSEITNQPTWTNNLAGAQNAVNDVVAWLNIPIGGMGSGDASEATLQQVDTKLGSIDSKLTTTNANTGTIASRLLNAGTSQSAGELLKLIETYLKNPPANGNQTTSELLKIIEGLLKNTGGLSIGNILTSSISGLTTADILEAITNFLANIETNSNFLSSIETNTGNISTLGTEATLVDIFNKLQNSFKTLNGTISALNGSYVINTEGYSTLNLNLDSGLNTSTLKLQYQNAGNWIDFPSNLIFDYTADQYINNSFSSLNKTYSIKVSGFQNVRLTCTLYGSTTINIFAFMTMGDSPYRLESLIKSYLYSIGSGLGAAEILDNVFNQVFSINNKTNNTDLSNTGTINGNGQNQAIINTNGHNTGSVQITGVFTGTLQIQLTIDGTTWVNITGSNSIVNAQTSSYLTNGNITVTGIYQFDIGGIKAFRVVSTAWTSGTATINTLASIATSLIAAEGIEGTQSVSQSGTWNVGNTAGTNLIGDVGVQYRANATGAASTRHLISQATTNTISVKATAGRVIGYCLSNLSASFKFVKLYNVNSVPVAGTTPVVITIAIPPNENITFSCEGGISFSAGIGLSIVNGAADNDATAIGVNEVIGDLFFA